MTGAASRGVDGQRRRSRRAVDLDRTDGRRQHASGTPPCACRAAASATTSRRRHASACCRRSGPGSPRADRSALDQLFCARNQALKALDAAGARKHQLLSRARSLDDHEPRAKAPLKLLENTVPAAGVREPVDSQFNGPFGEQLPSTSTDADPLRIVIAREQLDAVVAARQTMTTCERQALAGMLNDKSQRQLAAELGWSRKTVMLAQRRAREKLAAQGRPRCLSPRFARRRPPGDDGTVVAVRCACSRPLVAGGSAGRRLWPIPVDQARRQRPVAHGSSLPGMSRTTDSLGLWWMNGMSGWPLPDPAEDVELACW